MQKLRKNDEVIVISGKDKGAIGRIVELNSKKSLVKVDKVNIVKKHTKPTQQNTEGGILEKENWIHMSNVAYHVKGKGFSKIGFKINKDNKKVRYNKKLGKEF